MAYNIIYIEDLDASSLSMDIKQHDIEVTPHKPTSFNEVFLEMTSDAFQAILLDFKLDEESDNVILFNAPSLAQNLRTKNIEDKKYKPIFLITNQENISTYYKDFTSHDLFDFVKTKTEFRQRLPEMCIRIRSFIDCYDTISSSGGNLQKILKATDNQYSIVDYLIKETLEGDQYKDNTNKIAFYIYHKIIKSFNFLVGEDILSARLGIKKNSLDWNLLLEEFTENKYKGVYSSSHNRWWWNEIEEWWLNKTDGQNIRRLKGPARCEKISQITGLKRLVPAEKSIHSKSEYFWTICLDKFLPIDPLDGLELRKKNLLPWQDNEYISMEASLESSKLNKYLNNIDREKMIEYNKTL